MGNYELIYFERSLKRSSEDMWRDRIENIDGEIVEPILRDGYTRGFVVDTDASRTNE